MFIFSVVHGCYGRISEVVDTPKDVSEHREPLVVDLREHSLLIRGEISVMGDWVVAKHIEINSNSNNIKRAWKCLELSEDSSSWNDKNGDTATIQKFNEIVTIGRTLFVTE